MSAIKKITIGADARRAMLKGVEILEKAVTITLGPKGRMVMIDDGREYPVYTKDGVSVSRKVVQKNRLMEAGSATAKEAAERTNSNAGDGTTTTILLTAELMKEGVRLVESGFDPVEIQKGFDKACHEVLGVIGDFAHVVESPDEIEKVAFISANNDEEVGKIIRQAYEGIGEGGIVHVTDSHARSGETTVKFSSGLEIDKGTKRSGYFTNLKTETFEAENPRFLFCSCPVTFDFIAEYLKMAFREKFPLVVFAEEIEDEAETALLKQAKNGSVRCCQLPPPGFTLYEQQENMKDLIAVLGGRLIESSTDVASLSDLGTCGKVSIGFKKCVLSDTAPDEEAIEERAKQIDTEIEEGLNDADGSGISAEEIETLKLRKARLTGGVAEICIGANSVTRIKELSDRYDDATKAVRAAISDGIVPGGGLTLLKCSRIVESKFKDFEFKTRGQEIGFKGFLNVLRIPITRIISSVEPIEYAYIISTIEHELEKKNYGYNAKTQKYVDDMFEEGIVDPLKVETEALKNSTAAAGIFITTECALTPDADNILVEANDPLAMRDPDYNAFGVLN